MTVFEHLKKSKPGFLPVLDPDRWSDYGRLNEVIETFNEVATAILVGTSLSSYGDYERFLKYVRERARVPVIIFPHASSSVSSECDALFFLVLLSGRNPEYLVSQQVKSAFAIKRAKIEVIPVAYLLIEGGKRTSVEFMSATIPIPRDKPDIAVAHALVAQYMGMKMVYLEAGSGAIHPVPVEMIREVKDNTNLLVIVGGGIRTEDDIRERIENGADFIVMGNIFEQEDFDKNVLLNVFKR